ncbi:hypothetical protein [uncultured Robinsoniella sp.]
MQMAEMNYQTRSNPDTQAFPA